MYYCTYVLFVWKIQLIQFGCLKLCLFDKNKIKNLWLIFFSWFGFDWTGPLVLPASEQLLFLLSLIGRKIFNLKWKPYIPDFKLAFEHFCIHAGGRAVIDELQKNLQLSGEHVEASRMTLHRFGNTSSSSLWYELCYIESKGRMRRGDRVWQIAFGSGFKCNSAVWKCNRTIKTPNDGPWSDCIDRYPVFIPEVVKLWTKTSSRTVW